MKAGWVASLPNVLVQGLAVAENGRIAYAGRIAGCLSASFPRPSWHSLRKVGYCGRCDVILAMGALEMVADAAHEVELGAGVRAAEEVLLGG